MGREQYYQNNPLAELAALKARVATLEKAVLAGRGGATAAAAAGMAGISSDTPTAALPPAGEIPPVYFVDYETMIAYQGVVRTVEGKVRLYLQPVGRVRAAGS
jgi:hypothetical protein